MGRPPAWFGNYFCYNASAINPISTPPPCQKDSSSTHYTLKNYVTFTKFSPTYQQFLSTITKVVEPRFYHEVVKDEKWRKAMAEEISALEKNETCVIKNLPPGKKPISCKWISRVKYNLDSTVEQHKARLVIHWQSPS